VKNPDYALCTNRLEMPLCIDNMTRRIDLINATAMVLIDFGVLMSVFRTKINDSTCYVAYADMATVVLLP
jgi:hypothetical protein